MNRNIEPDPPAPGKVELWEINDTHHPNNSPLQGDEHFQGPVRTRTCRDFLCFLVFMVFNAGLVALCVLSNA